MASDHISFILNGLSGTYPAWANPDKSQPVNTASFTASRVLNRYEDTGAVNRSRRYASQGGVTNGTGSINMKGYPRGLFPYLFRSFLTNMSQAASGTGYNNYMQPNDGTDVQLPWFSFQTKRGSTIGENIRGAVLNTLTLSCAGGEDLMVQAGFLVNDVTRVGQPWSEGGSNSASLQSLAYPSPLPPPLRFHEAALTRGGTASDGGGQRLDYAGGTTIAKMENINIAFTLNTENRYAIRDGAPTAAYTRHGERTIEITGEIDWADYGTTYYDAMRAATETTLEVDFTSDGTYSSGQSYKLRLVFPRVIYPEDGGVFPQVDGSHMPKKIPIKLLAMMDETLLTDVAVQFKTLDDLTSA